MVQMALMLTVLSPLNGCHCLHIRCLHRLHPPKHPGQGLGIHVPKTGVCEEGCLPIMGFIQLTNWSDRRGCKVTGEDLICHSLKVKPKASTLLIGRLFKVTLSDKQAERVKAKELFYCGECPYYSRDLHKGIRHHWIHRQQSITCPVTSLVFTGTLIKVEPLNINQPVSDSMQQQLNQFLVMKFLQDYNVTPLGMTNACHETADGFQTFSAIVVQQEGGLEALKLRLMNMTEKELMRTVLNMKVVKRTRVFDEKAAVVQLLKVKKAKVSIRVALDALHQGRPRTALKYLNCAIKEADENSEELFQAKKYRAEVLYNHCYHAEALQDLEDCLSAKALTEICNHHIRELLVGLDLKARCLENLGKLAESRKCFMLAKKAGFPEGVHQGVKDILEQDWNLHISCLDTCCCLHPKSDWEEFSPGFQVSSLMADGVNRFVPTAAKCLELQSSEKYGRGFIAKDDLPPGTILISERPFARALSHSAADSHCNYCLTYCSFPMPCYKCKSAVFCSAKCQDMANDSYHLKYECESMAAILDKLEIQEGLVPRVVYRLFAQRTKTYFTSRRQLLDEALKAGWKPAGTTHNQLFDAQEVLSTLELFRHPVDPQKAAYEALLSVYIVKLLKGCGYFGSVTPATTELTSKDQQSDADILLISRLVLHYVRHLKTQTFTVSSVVVPCSGYESPQGSQVVGLAMCPTISFLNHSCVPNACVVGAMDEDKLVVVAMKGIAKGEQDVLLAEGMEIHLLLPSMFKPMANHKLFARHNDPHLPPMFSKELLLEPAKMLLTEAKNICRNLKQLTNTEHLNYKSLLSVLHELIREVDLAEALVQQPCKVFWKGVFLIGYLFLLGSRNVFLERMEEKSKQVLNFPSFIFPVEMWKPPEKSVLKAWKSSLTLIQPPFYELEKDLIDTSNKDDEEDSNNTLKRIAYCTLSSSSTDSELDDDEPLEEHHQQGKCLMRCLPAPHATLVAWVHVVAGFALKCLCKAPNVLNGPNGPEFPWAVVVFVEGRFHGLGGLDFAPDLAIGREEKLLVGQAQARQGLFWPIPRVQVPPVGCPRVVQAQHVADVLTEKSSIVASRTLTINHKSLSLTFDDCAQPEIHLLQHVSLVLVVVEEIVLQITAAGEGVKVLTGVLGLVDPGQHPS
ncbi:unnamed protein product [Notodromas monacha]|uniref:SET domain-containing protein n=1 Tax=Notodromas monacha TaxID=399045 RepID=A0A7R9GAI3_9CRUS|nr:unnamed protein product [Notodromas monacha]CAG0915399.1 unnamed protein product [Notodromas monacha]